MELDLYCIVSTDGLAHREVDAYLLSDLSVETTSTHPFNISRRNIGYQMALG